MCTEFWLESLKERAHSGRIILRLILGRQGRRVWTGFMWLRIDGGLL
jgi:hypothetical protein